MYSLKENQLYASEIAMYLTTEHVGADHIVTKPVDSRNPEEGGIFYLECSSQEQWEEISPIGMAVVVITNFIPQFQDEKVTIIKSNNPQVDFYRVVNEFFVQIPAHRISDLAVIQPGAGIGFNVNVGNNSVIGSQVKIGNNVYIGDRPT